MGSPCKALIETDRCGIKFTLSNGYQYQLANCGASDFLL